MSRKRTAAQIKAERKYEAEHRTERAKSKTWLAMIYPDSMPPNWREIVSSWGVPTLATLHDKDQYSTGDEAAADDDQRNRAQFPVRAGGWKKPHIHLVIMFEKEKPFSHVAYMIEPLRGSRPIKPGGSLAQAAAYLIHANDKSKHQYDASEVIEFCGASFAEALEKEDDKYTRIGAMMDYCDAKGVRSFASLMRYARDEEPGWFKTLCDNGAYVVKEYQKSLSWDDHQQDRRAYEDSKRGGSPKTPAR